MVTKSIFCAAASMPDPGSYQSIGWIVMAVAGLCVAINQVLKLLDRLKEKPPPCETYVTRVQCASAHGEMARRLEHLETELPSIKEELQKMFRDLDRRDEERSSNVHKRLDTVTTASATTQGKVSQLAEQVIELNRSIKDVMMLKG